MQLHEIESVVITAENGSFTAAAKKLYVSQPALSQNVRKLEKELGIEIFRREGNRLILTSAGEMVVEEGKKILERCDVIRKKASDLCNLKTGRLKVAITPLYGQVFFSRVYSGFHRLYPEVEIGVVEAQGEDQIKMLMNHAVDVGIFSSSSKEVNIVSEPVYHERMVLCMDTENPLNRFGFIDACSNMPFIRLEELQDADFIGFTADRSNLSAKTVAICREHGFDPRIVYASSYSSVICSLISCGMGIGLLSYMSIYGVPLQNEKYSINYYNVTGKNAERTYACYYPRDGYTSVLTRTFIEVCKGVHAELIETNREMRFFLECRRTDWPQFVRCLEDGRRQG